MEGKIQGVCSTTLIEPSKEVIEEENNNQHEKKYDILTSSYDMKKIVYTYQTGKFPHSSSRGNKYHMIIPDIYRNSTWMDPINYLTEVETILGRARALKLMKLCGIIPKNQVLNNESPGVYKDAIK